MTNEMSFRDGIDPYDRLANGDRTLRLGHRLMRKVKNDTSLSVVTEVWPRKFGGAENPLFNEDVVAAAGQFAAAENVELVAYSATRKRMLRGEQPVYVIQATDIEQRPPAPLASIEKWYGSVTQIYPPVPNPQESQG